ncbi:MAG: LPS export ABC transporter periplasmic protein LptC [Rickettsiales bacterium]|nr:LPS export ABC transporter periplasmic protein LptC [Rickettsiales bacterium]MCA0254558.1 LPS export ABC transporter periplasmic protein LptC [Pseudomonadota bacterium]
MYLFNSNRNKITVIKYIFLLCAISIFSYVGFELTISENRNSSVLPPIKASDNSNATKTKEYSMNLDNPIFDGTNKDNIPYKIIAKKVLKNRHNQYLLNSLNAKFYMPNGVIEVKSNKGTMNEKNESFVLEDEGMVIFGDIFLKSEKINFDINKKTINTPLVQLIYLNSQITAQQLYSEDFSSKIIFKGNVKSCFDLDDF